MWIYVLRLIHLCDCSLYNSIYINKSACQKWKSKGWTLHSVVLYSSFFIDKNSQGSGWWTCQHSIQNHLVKSIIKSFCCMELNHNKMNILHFWKAWRWLIDSDVELGTETKVQQGTLLPASLNLNQTRTPAQTRLHHSITWSFYKNCHFLQTLGRCKLGFEFDLICLQQHVCVWCSQFVFSRTIAIPWPPPMQAEPTAYFPPRLLWTENTTHHMTSCYINTAMHDGDYTTWKWHLKPILLP